MSSKVKWEGNRKNGKLSHIINDSNNYNHSVCQLFTAPKNGTKKSINNL